MVPGASIIGWKKLTQLWPVLVYRHRNSTKDFGARRPAESRKTKRPLKNADTADSADSDGRGSGSA